MILSINAPLGKSLLICHHLNKNPSPDNPELLGGRNMVKPSNFHSDLKIINFLLRDTLQIKNIRQK